MDVTFIAPEQDKKYRSSDDMVVTEDETERSSTTSSPKVSSGAVFNLKSNGEINRESITTAGAKGRTFSLKKGRTGIKNLKVTWSAKVSNPNKK